MSKRRTHRSAACSRARYCTYLTRFDLAKRCDDTYRVGDKIGERPISPAIDGGDGSRTHCILYSQPAFADYQSRERKRARLHQVAALAIARGTDANSKNFRETDESR